MIRKGLSVQLRSCEALDKHNAFHAAREGLDCEGPEMLERKPNEMLPWSVSIQVLRKDCSPELEPHQDPGLEDAWSYQGHN